MRLAVWSECSICVRLSSGKESYMKPERIKNTVVDEANQVTYVVTANRVLTDGELYSAIRVALLLQGRKRVGRGETLVIAAPDKI